MLDLATIDKKLLTAQQAKNGQNVIIFGRLTWPKLFVPQINKADKGKENPTKKYTIGLLIPPVSDLTLLKTRCSEVATERWGDKVKTMKLKSPFLKAEDYKYEGHLPGWTFLRLNAISKPDVLEKNKDGQLVKLSEEDPERVYGGRWAQVSVNPFAYPKSGGEDLGNRGVSIGLNNVLLLNHDESLGGRIKAEDEFEAPEGDFGSEAAGSTIDSMF